jgi:hypothetical protein
VQTCDRSSVSLKVVHFCAHSCCQREDEETWVESSPPPFPRRYLCRSRRRSHRVGRHCGRDFPPGPGDGLASWKLFALFRCPFRRSARFCFASARAVFGSLDGGTDESFEVCPSLASRSATLFLSSEIASRSSAFSARTEAISDSSPATRSPSATTLFYMKARGRWWMVASRRGGRLVTRPDPAPNSLEASPQPGISRAVTWPQVQATRSGRISTTQRTAIPKLS